jgi:hypothetical protein
MTKVEPRIGFGVNVEQRAARRPPTPPCHIECHINVWWLLQMKDKKMTLVTAPRFNGHLV